MSHKDPQDAKSLGRADRHSPARPRRNLEPAPAADSCSGSQQFSSTGKDRARRCWVVAETLSGPARSSVVLDGAEPRQFSKLTRSSIAANALVARELDSVVRECATAGGTCSTEVTLPDGQVKRIAAIPVIGPSGRVHATRIWVDSVNAELPEKPVVGAMEWSAGGVVTADPAATYLLQLPFGELPHGNTIPELLSRFDQWDDRANFLSMFNMVNPTDHWIGTATTTYDDGTDHQLQFAARASGHGPDRVVRAIVFEAATDPSAICTDPCTLVFRQMPIPLGHAMGLVDLPSGFVHEWLAEQRTPLAGWRHHQPEFDYNSRLLAAETCFALASGVRREAATQARLRFSPQDEWMVLDAKWTRINGRRRRPQALIDVTPVSPNPVPLIRGCRICQDLVHRPTPAAWGPEFESPATE
ncbi:MULTISPECIES: GAF domain-containing protein [unclassified Nocardia]|uniref:GAF domain-containing protein n=1 Tax=unclassified Nocardia TaxID=2637762 RepID=UPI00278BC36B|nr:MULTISPECIES: GAF domain-containing protein [unclassified Nocardia]